MIALDTCLAHACGHSRDLHSDDGRCTGTRFNAGFFASPQGTVPCDCQAYTDDAEGRYPIESDPRAA